MRMTMTQHAKSWTLKPGAMTLADLRAVWAAPAKLILAAEAYPVIEASAAAVQAIVAKGDAAYGINTGFGLLAKTRIPDEKLEQLQRNLILSHSVGTGELLSDAVVRLIMLMKIGSLARGFSGVRPLIVDTLIALYNAGIMPAIPAKGSVGASGAGISSPLTRTSPTPSMARVMCDNGARSPEAPTEPLAGMAGMMPALYRAIRVSTIKGRTPE